MSKKLIALLLTGILLLAVFGSVLAANPNPGVIPNSGGTKSDLSSTYKTTVSGKYGDLGAKWYQWAFSFPAADLPYFNTGGPVDTSAHQSGNVWFLAGANFGLTEPRTGKIPMGKSLFFPMVDLINDYPCPPQFGFEPPPGESLEHFLQRTGNDAMDQFVAADPTKLFAVIDGTPLAGLTAYRSTSSLFTFTADPALADPTLPFPDPCITGSPQVGVAVGYFLLLPPLTPGAHTLHFGLNAAPGNFPQDITYNLTVTKTK